MSLILLRLLGKVVVISFTAGVGENNPRVRAAATADLQHFGLLLDEDRNAERSRSPRVISADGSPVTIMVVPTDEELAIARKAEQLVE